MMNAHAHKHRTARKNPGFTLLEVAIALIIIGTFIAAAIGLYNKSEQQQLMVKTRDNMRIVMQALSSYAETAGRLPCPADPGITDEVFGWEWGLAATDLEIDAGSRPVGTCGNINAAAANNNVTGIVPFQTLNLPLHVIRDGWGRYFTYSVSPVFTQNNDRTGQPTDEDSNIHAQCRTAAWLNDSDVVSTYKARFCCAAQSLAGATYAPATDLVIELVTDPGTAISPTRVGFAADPATGYAPIATMTVGPGDVKPSAPVHATSNITAPAFVLISHGSNGAGAFLGNDTRNTFAGNGIIGNAERDNFDYDRTYVTGQRNLSNNVNNYFDDIVLWMTQDGIMAANGTSSCQYP